RAHRAQARRNRLRGARARLPGVSSRPLCRVQPGLRPRNALRLAVERTRGGHPDVTPTNGEMALRLAPGTRQRRSAPRHRFPGRSRLARMKKTADDAHLVETTVESTDVFRGKLLYVRRDTVRLPDGAQAMREYIVHPGAVMIIPRLSDGKLLLERQ